MSGKGKGPDGAKSRPKTKGKGAGDENNNPSSDKDRAYETDTCSVGKRSSRIAGRAYASDAAQGDPKPKTTTPPASVARTKPVESRRAQTEVAEPPVVTPARPEPAADGRDEPPVLEPEEAVQVAGPEPVGETVARPPSEEDTDAEIQRVRTGPPPLAKPRRKLKRTLESDAAETGGIEVRLPAAVQRSFERVIELANQRVADMKAKSVSARSTPRSSDVTTDNESLHSARSGSTRSVRSHTDRNQALREVRYDNQMLKAEVRKLRSRDRRALIAKLARTDDATDWLTAADDVPDQFAIEAQIRAENAARAQRQASSQSVPPGGQQRREDQTTRATSLQRTAAGAGAPGGGDDDGDDGDSDRELFRRWKERHIADASRRRAARLSDNPAASRPPSLQNRSCDPTSQPSHSQPSATSFNFIQPQFASGQPSCPPIHPVPIPVAPPTRLHIEQVTLPKFDGKAFNLFYKQFDSIANDQQWTAQVKARKLLESLEGDTRRHVEASMTYDEMLDALRQYYAGARPSVEAKNTLRNFRKDRGETIEEFASRIQAYADEARLSPFDKTKYMQEAFLSGISYDPAMQRYIEKKTTQQDNTPIVKLLKAAQDYQHNKQGSTSGPIRRRDFNSHMAGNGQRGRQNPGGQAQPSLQVLKTGRKEPLSHDDPAVQEEAEQEQEKVRQERQERSNQRAAASRKELERMQEKIEALQQELERQKDTKPQQQPQQQNGNFPPRNDGYRGGGRGGYRNNFNNDGYRNDRGGYKGNGRGRGGYQTQRNDNNYNQRNDGNYKAGNQGYHQGGYRGGNNGGYRGNGRSNYDSQPRRNNGMPQDVRQEQRRSQPGPTPTRPLTQGQQTVAPAPQLNQHAAMDASGDAQSFMGLDPNVYPEDGVYCGSSAASQA